MAKPRSNFPPGLERIVPRSKTRWFHPEQSRTLRRSFDQSRLHFVEVVAFDGKPIVDRLFAFFPNELVFLFARLLVGQINFISHQPAVQTGERPEQNDGDDLNCRTDK